MTHSPPTRHPAFAHELAELKRSDSAEVKAIEHAIAVLQTMGPRGGFPHTSAVRTSSQFALRELRPRRGRSRHRVLFTTRGGRCILLALAPEANHRPRAFRQSVLDAHQRIMEFDMESADDVCN
jgi:hypothetical protein